METLTAVGLASNIVQFICFARDLVSTTRQISRNADGALIENLEIEAIARNLDRLSSSLRVSPLRKDGKPITNPMYSKEEEVLKQLCDGCQRVARLLIVKVKSLKVDSKPSGRTGRKWASIRQALSSVLAADEIEGLQARLDRYQKTINTTLLASLRAQINQAEENREVREVTMSRHLSGFIHHTKAWQADLIDTLHRNNWRPDRARDVELFAHQLANGAQIDKDTLNQRRIHYLLQFEEIAERHETIAEAHKKTFEWVFHRAGPKPFPIGTSTSHDEPLPEPQWDNFVDWLHGSHNLYWITGKPGSGKSTLMKYLYNNRRTADSAITWSGSNELITAGFFFWNSGTAMQMSRMGLLQTLLSRCLEGREHHIPFLFPTRWTRYTLFGGDMRPWTWLELTSALKKLLSMEHFSYLLFIDGLDEFDGDPKELASLVLDFMRISPYTIKLCVASRPWLVFEESFQHIPSLRMEDLTRPDIQLYVEENMSESTRWRDLQQFMPEEAIRIVEEIADKAVGVFLWVTLVVASLLCGLRDGDTVEDLWSRVDELPSTLEELFQKILGDLTPGYFVQGCELFQLAFTAFEPLTLLDMSLAHDGCAAAIKAPLGQIAKGELAFRAETMRRRIISRSKGLLEVPTASVLRERAKVEYLHRTVRDFFQSEQAWTYIREGAPDFDAPLMLSASFLRQVKMTGVEWTGAWDQFWRSFTYSVAYVRKHEDAGGTARIDILDALDRAGDAYWSQNLQINPLHSERYGTWLAELVDTSISRTNQPNWTRIVSLSPFKDIATQTYPPTNSMVNVSQLRGSKCLPHWLNTINLADLRNTPILDEIQREAGTTRLECFFDFAFVLQLNLYLSTKLSRQIVRHHTIEQLPLLFRALQDRNYSIAHILLDHGADPNAKSGQFGTVWKYLLRHARDQDKEELYSLALAFLEHGADLTAITPKDFDHAFAHLDYGEQYALMQQVRAAKQKRKPEERTDNQAPTRLVSVRKVMKQRFRSISLFKK